MHEDLTNMQKFSGWGFVLVSVAFCLLFLGTAASHVKAQSKLKEPPPSISEAEDDINALKMTDMRIENKLDRLADVVANLAKQEEKNTDKLYEMNSKVIWIYGTGGGAFGLMGFLQYLSVRRQRK